MTEMLTNINTCSVVVMASIIMILGLVRAVATWRQDDIPSEGDKSSQPRGKQGEMCPDHHSSEVILESEQN